MTASRRSASHSHILLEQFLLEQSLFSDFEKRLDKFTQELIELHQDIDRLLSSLENGPAKGESINLFNERMEAVKIKIQNKQNELDTPLVNEFIKNVKQHGIDHSDALLNQYDACARYFQAIGFDADFRFNRIIKGLPPIKKNAKASLYFIERNFSYLETLIDNDKTSLQKLMQCKKDIRGQLTIPFLINCHLKIELSNEESACLDRIEKLRQKCLDAIAMREYHQTQTSSTAQLLAVMTPTGRSKTLSMQTSTPPPAEQPMIKPLITTSETPTLPRAVTPSTNMLRCNSTPSSLYQQHNAEEMSIRLNSTTSTLTRESYSSQECRA